MAVRQVFIATQHEICGCGMDESGLAFFQLSRRPKRKQKHFRHLCDAGDTLQLAGNDILDIAKP